MSLHRSAAAALAAAVLAAGPALPVLAQTDTEMPQATQPTAPTDAELQSYAAAAMEIQSIVEERQPQIEGAATPEEANEIGLQAQEEMVMAVEAEGLTVEQYNQITQLAQADPDLQAKILDYVQGETQ